MPRGDRTGPDGMGPMTGRGLGYCNNFDSPGYTKNIPAGMGERFGCRGGGLGYGFRSRNRTNWNYISPAPANYDAKSQKTFLENEIKMLSQQLEEMKNRLSKLSPEE